MTDDGAMDMRILTITAGILALSGNALAQSIPVQGVAFGASETDLHPAIDAACNAVTRIEIDNTRFPEAFQSEVHLRCQGLTLADNQSAGDAMFTFADDALVMFETRGAPNAMVPDVDPVANVGGFDAYMPHLILVNGDAGQAWMLSSPMLVGLAFSWANPAWENDAPSAPMGSYAMPDEIVFGASLDDIDQLVKDKCNILRIDDIAEAWLRTEPAKQQQLNCYGIEIGGYPRKLEYVFGDGVLEQMWVLFGPSDIDRLRVDLTDRYGPAIHGDEDYEVFDDWRIAIRKDKPEILMGSDRLAEIWKRDGL